MRHARSKTPSPRVAWSTLLVSALASLGAAAPSNNGIEIVGSSGVSAQQLFLGQSGKVYIIDKTEGNGNNLNINGHPAWATEYDIATNTYRAMDVVTNSFCAGGNVLGNGTWLNVGGNQAIGPGGLNAVAGAAPYNDGDGGMAIRTLDTCTDGTCDWTNNHFMTTRRWYPSLETLEDGSMIIIGGCDWGGYVNDASQNNPTFEFYPRRGGPIGLNILTTTLPANLYPLTWLLPSGNLFIQANLGTEIFDYKNNIEYPLADIPHAVRTYPGSAATAMMPLTPANNWTATILFCGGTNLQPDQWVVTWNIAAYPADSTCVSMTPDLSTTWVDEEPLPEGRVMGNWIFLPDGRLVLINGIGKGTAGYGNTSWAIGQSFGDDPIHSVRYFDYNQPLGKRFSSAVANSTVDRMYHSSATLLPDGSVMSSGSNPNADFVSPGSAGYKYPTEYRVERFYPDYFTATRPKPTGLPTTLGYGGNYFTVQLSAADLGAVSNADNTKVVLLRTGFSTHAIQSGMRYVQLNSTFAISSSGAATLHVSQVPPNPAILAPGPALIFVVVNGVPSNGQWVMIGSGTLGAQTILATQQLPDSTGGDGGAWNSGQGAQTQTPTGAARASGTGTGAQTGAATGVATGGAKSAAGRREVAWACLVVGLGLALGA